ncbi:MAG: hypothetical protein JXQ29_06710 [Planctomycetes bacterium]|nr:hypothetical protein [Planctomycetota bacterium]
MKLRTIALALVLAALAATVAASQSYDAAGNWIGGPVAGLDDPPGTKLLEYLNSPTPSGLTRIGDLFYGLSSTNLYEFNWQTGAVFRTIALTNLPTFSIYAFDVGFDLRRNLFVIAETSAMGILLADQAGVVTTFFSTSGVSHRNVGAAYDTWRDGYWITSWNTNRLTLYDARNLGNVLFTIDLSAVGATRAAGAAYSSENDIVYTNSRDKKMGYAFEAASGKLLYSWPLVYQGSNNGQGSVWWDRWNAAVVVDLETGLTVFHETGYPRVKAADTVKVGSGLRIDWIAANSPGKFYKGAAAFTERIAGIQFLNRYFPLAADNLFFASLTAPSVFQRFEGLLDTTGTAVGAVNVPNIPALAGLYFSIAFVTVDPAAPFAIDAISGAWKVNLTK